MARYALHSQPKRHDNAIGRIVATRWKTSAVEMTVAAGASVFALALFAAVNTAVAEEQEITMKFGEVSLSDADDAMYLLRSAAINTGCEVSYTGDVAWKDAYGRRPLSNERWQLRCRTREGTSFTCVFRVAVVVRNETKQVNEPYGRSVTAFRLESGVEVAMLVGRCWIDNRDVLTDNCLGDKGPLAPFLDEVVRLSNAGLQKSGDVSH